MAMQPKHILVAVLDWGLGHATRSMVVINALLKDGYKVSIAGNGQSLELLKQEYLHLNYYELEPYDVKYSSSGSFMLNILWQLPKFLKAIQTEHQQIEQLQSTYKFDCVISDNRYGCRSDKVPSVLITHQLNIQLKGLLSLFQGGINYFNHRLIKRFTFCWVPDFRENRITGKLTDTDYLNVRFIGMLSRFLKHETKIEEDLIVGIVSGPEPQRTDFESMLTKEMQQQKSNCIIIRGIVEGPTRKDDHVTFINHLSAVKLNELIERAGVVISRSGYSTIMDLAALQKKQIIIVPTPGQTEQEYLAKELDRDSIAIHQSQNQFNLSLALQGVKQYKGFDSNNLPNNLLPMALNELIERTN